MSFLVNKILILFLFRFLVVTCENEPSEKSIDGIAKYIGDLVRDNEIRNTQSTVHDVVFIRFERVPNNDIVEQILKNLPSETVVTFHSLDKIINSQRHRVPEFFVILSDVYDAVII